MRATINNYKSYVFKIMTTDKVKRIMNSNDKAIAYPARDCILIERAVVIKRSSYSCGENKRMLDCQTQKCL